jgi:phage protein D
MMRFADFSQKYGDFLAPAFAVRVSGADLIRDDFIAVTQIEVDLVLGAISRFSFTVTNAFDMDRREFLDSSGKDLLETFAFGAEVDVAAGYGDTTKLPVLITGIITEVGTNFADGGTPELTVAGYDHGYPMSVGKSSVSWAQRRDSDIAGDLARLHNLATDITPTDVQHPQIEQNQESDLEFIRKLADRNERYKIYVTDKTLHFAPARDKQDPVVTLPYGAGLLSFKPEANLAGQVSAVEIIGWDVAQKQMIIGRARRGDEPGRDPRRDSGGDYLQRAVPNPPVLRLRQPVRSQAEADQRAKAALAERAQEFLTGEGETLGLPEIRPDTMIALEAVGRRFSKPYYVEEATHKIDSSGYRTRFKVKETTL